MKTRIISTTRFVASTEEEEKEFVFCMKPCSLSADLPLTRLGVKEYRVIEDNDIAVYAVTPNQKPDDKPYVFSKKEWIDALIDTFCADCDSDDEIYLLLHARTDLPPTEYGPYDASNLIENNRKLIIHVWAFAHEKDSNLGAQPLLKVSYPDKRPTPVLFANKVRALFKLAILKPQIDKVWAEYSESGSQELLNQSVIPLLEKINSIEGIKTINVDDFKSLKDEMRRNDIIEKLKDVSILRTSEKDISIPRTSR